MSLPLRSIGLTAVGALLCVSLGATLGVYVVAPPVPESLAGPAEVTTALASSRAFDDERTVRVTVKLRESEPVMTPATGRVTALSLVPNSKLDSGTKIMDVDGIPVVALHTGTPLFRDVVDDVAGEDIEALQSELQRLGYAVDVTGKGNWQTRNAAADLLGVNDGQGGVPESIPFNRFLWLPAASVTVNEVKAHLGDILTEGATLLTLTGGALSGSVTIPEGARPGSRVLVYQDQTYPVGENGVIEDQKLLAELAASPLFAGSGANDEGGENKSEVAASLAWRLASPLDVQIVPAAALFGVTGDQGCVAGVDGKTHKVDIVASELGQTFVQAEAPLGEVTLKTEGLSCQ